jgi:hypothetical protein
MAAKKNGRGKSLRERQGRVTPKICLNCNLHSSRVVLSSIHPSYCVHFTPEYWVDQGYERDWGDAAVMNWPHLEILRQQTGQDCRFVILAPHAQRRPVELYASDPHAWGAY